MKDALYKRSNLARLPELQKLVPEAAKTYYRFMDQAFEPRVLSARVKELIAVAVAHVTGCPYCIEVHVGKLKAEQGTSKEIAEAIVAASVIQAEAVMLHGTNALAAFQGSGEDALYPPLTAKAVNELRGLSEEAFESFDRFAEQALASGAVDARTKALIAVIIAHVAGCAYSIGQHTRRFVSLGGTREELAEGVAVGGAVNAGYVLVHGVHALQAFDDAAGPVASTPSA
ncbi:alkylhydroperoxidase like protein, AhpD family [Paenibacillus curdlanolyticus YK9]|uniref:Alkylhydroperoxidase like protein, AhpD family n=1 Tax=Paenibacillus curdlanolyticus YK9 TaxID=717606 RepID=E0IAI5_9BACL|nr:carboxymuconolactone decarboxylase family protein [Paenibacillus curdlanolyticus]EFM10762.1 alkylhydroperoxidase like protein, AhpD family [Paenibacillus curdlanolyticus YK9]